MTRIKKRIWAIIVVGMMTLGLMAGCQKNDSTGQSQENTTTENSQNSSNDPYANTTSIEITRLMGNGINLGNTMEAYGRGQYGTKANVSVYEGFWGQPITTKEMIAGMKTAGFDSIRIPVAWTNKMNYETGDYTIDSSLLDRVDELISYAIAADMFVIVNDHWDGGWWGMFGSASEDTRNKAMDMYVSMWKQIAEKYEKYDSHLIFESANEELGNRLNDKDIARDSGTLSMDECYATANKINQTFVDTIRASGANNSNRFLLIAGYDTDITKTCDDRYKMPTDTATDKLIVSVHYYDPSGYCIQKSSSSWGNRQHVEEMNDKLGMMTKFTEAGYGVIIGEYGVLIDGKATELRANTVDYLKNFLNNCDYYGYCPVLWDCNNYYDKTECAITNQIINKLYYKYSFAEQSKMSDEDVKNAAKVAMDKQLDSAEVPATIGNDESIAWIMYNSSDWGTMYRVGDKYPADITDGIIATEPKITGAGTYTVALDFTGTATGVGNGTAFCALGIFNGELLYPGYVVEIKEIKVNGEIYTPIAKEYTTSDDQKCTRVNIFNQWVPDTAIPDTARTVDGSRNGISATIVDASDLGSMKTIEITFDYIEK